MNLIFFGKSGCPYTAKALSFCRSVGDCESYLGDWGDRFPEDSYRWKGDLVISYNSRWIIPDSITRYAQVAAINFHPGPPEYPGVGCVNWALYENAQYFGVTAHRLAFPVDTGEIYDVAYFKIHSWDTVETLLERTYSYPLTQFYSVMEERLWNDIGFFPSGEQWSQVRHTRKDLDALSRITPDMPPDEVARRIRATAFGQWRPRVTVGEYNFELKEGKR